MVKLRFFYGYDFVFFFLFFFLFMSIFVDEWLYIVSVERPSNWFSYYHITSILE